MDEEKYKSRKFRLTVWAFILGSIISLAQVVLLFKNIEFPSWLGVVASTCISTGIVYIGGNVYQKTHTEEKEEKIDG